MPESDPQLWAGPRDWIQLPYKKYTYLNERKVNTLVEPVAKNNGRKNCYWEKLHHSLRKTIGKRVTDSGYAYATLRF